MKRDLTTGSVLKTVVYFSLPYLLSYFLQTLYGMADLFIIGQFDGVESTTAVSTGSQVMHMITVMIVGLAMGGTVMIGQAIGGKKYEKASKSIGNTVVLFMAVSVVMTIVLLIFVKPIVSVMSTPEEAVSGTVSYLTICFIGIPAITAYNIISSIFRGLGDSKSPMYFVAIACVCNIALDYLFIGAMDMGPAGAALGTTISQTISVIVALVVIVKRDTGINLSKSDFRPEKSTMSGILKIGVPIAVQDGLVQVAFIVITVFANMRSLNDAAAVGIVEKLISILFLVPSSMLQTISALSAQNIGADRYDRARQVLKYGTMMAVGWGIFAVILMQLAADPIISLFTTSSEVVVMGGQYMRGYVWDCILAGVHFCFSGYFCACGKSILSFIHNILSISCARIPLVYFASVNYPDTLFPMGIATCTGSALSVVICVIAFIWITKKQKKTEAVA